MKQAGIIGCGWLGTRIALRLMPEYQVWATTRSDERQCELEQLGIVTRKTHFAEELLQQTGFPPQQVTETDLLIIAVNFPKKQSTEQLTNKFKNIAAFLGPCKNPLFLMSSTGIYPHEAVVISEDTFPENELHPALWKTEQLARLLYPQINILRLGGLMGDDRFLSKYTISSPSEPVNHIHYTDIPEIILKMVNLGISSTTYNVVAPLHPQKQQVIDFQTNGVLDRQVQSKGRIVSSGKLVSDLGYQFISPDPLYFKS